MSAILIKQILMHSPVTDPMTTLVLVCLAEWADDNGTQCYPSIGSIAKRARCSESTARRHVKRLAKDGLIHIGKPSDGRSTNHYRIVVPQPGQNDTPATVTGVDQTVTGATHPADTISPAQTDVIHRVTNTVTLTGCHSDRGSVRPLSLVHSTPVTRDTAPLSRVTPNQSFISHEQPAAGREPQPPLIHQLETAVRAAGLGARFDRLTDTEIATIETLILTHGVPALVASARSQHRADNPAHYAKAWIGSWLALPVRQTAAPATKTECGACDHGWLPENSQGQAVACPTCRPLAAARTVYATAN